MPNFIQRPRLFNPAAAYQQGQANRIRDDMNQQTQQINAFNLQQDQQMAPIRQQAELLELKTNFQKLGAAQQKQALETANRVRAGATAFRNQPLPIQMQEYDRYYAMNGAMGGDDNDLPTPDEFRADPGSLERWHNQFDWQLGELQRDLKVTEVGTTGGQRQKILYDPADPNYTKPLGSAYTKKPLVGDISVDARTKMDSATDQAVGKSMANRYTQIWEAGNAAEETISQVRQLKGIDIKTGALEPAKASFGAVLSGLGFENLAMDIADVPNAQSFNAVSARLVNKVLNEAKGPQTEGDAQRARSTISRLGNHPNARSFIEDSLLALALRKVQMRDFIDDKINIENKSFRQALADWRKYTLSTPNISSFRKDKNGFFVFYFNFKTALEQANPGITEAEIIEVWNKK